MKTKKFQTKLNLNKSVISKLTNEQEKNILGGAMLPSDFGASHGYTGKCKTGTRVDCPPNYCDTVEQC